MHHGEKEILDLEELEEEEGEKKQTKGIIKMGTILKKGEGGVQLM